MGDRALKSIIMGMFKENKAQAVLEMAIAIACVFLLLFGILNVFIWMNKRLIMRHEDYEAQRVEAGSVSTDRLQEVQVDESEYPALNILGN